MMVMMSAAHVYHIVQIYEFFRKIITFIVSIHSKFFKKGGNMKIRINAHKFSANEAQIQFINKKVERLDRFISDKDSEIEVALSLEPESKKVQLSAEGNIISRNSSTFEDAITAAVDAMKEKLVREKEKGIQKKK